MGIGERLREWGYDVLRVIYPDVCHVCGTPLVRGEQVMCLKCRVGLPRTGIHTDPFNVMHQRMADPGVPINRAGAYFYYSAGGEYSRLILHGKYSGFPKVLRQLAREYASEVAADGFFDAVDAIVPVPLSRRKLWRRGYNQSEWIARGVSDATGLPVVDVLHARHHGSQTRRNVAGRWANASSAYSLAEDADDLHGLHLLLVDDIITTGATLLNCAKILLNDASAAQVSVLTLGCNVMQ